MVDTTTLTNLGPRNFMRLHPLVTMSVAIVRHDEWVDAAYTTRIKGDPVAGLGTVSSASRVYYASVSQVNAYANCAPMLTAPNNMEAAKIELSSAGPGVPVFHLPYNDNQNIRMTLVDKQGIGNVNFFLTEFIDGCSVYVQGSRTNPSVSHLNAKETLRRQDWTQYFWSEASKKQADWDAKYAKMDMRFKTEGTPVKVVRAGTLGMPAPSKLENHDYMGDLGLDLGALQAAQKVPTHAGGHLIDGFELMSQQGVAFGERNRVRASGSFTCSAGRSCGTCTSISADSRDRGLSVGHPFGPTILAANKGGKRRCLALNRP